MHIFFRNSNNFFQKFEKNQIFENNFFVEFQKKWVESIAHRVPSSGQVKFWKSVYSSCSYGLKSSKNDDYFQQIITSSNQAQFEIFLVEAALFPYRKVFKIHIFNVAHFGSLASFFSNYMLAENNVFCLYIY